MKIALKAELEADMIVSSPVITKMSPTGHWMMVNLTVLQLF